MGGFGNSNNDQVETDDDLEDKTCAEQVKCAIDEHDLIYWFVSGLNELYHSKIMLLNLPIVIKSKKPNDDEFESNLDNGIYKDNISYRDKFNNIIIKNIDRTSSRNCHNQDRVEIEIKANIEEVPKVLIDDKSVFDSCIENKDINRLSISKLAK
ncbi:44175_t:CDS:2, partial [Gigaspora margarita]